MDVRSVLPPGNFIMLDLRVGRDAGGGEGMGSGVRCVLYASRSLSIPPFWGYPTSTPFLKCVCILIRELRFNRTKDYLVRLSLSLPPTAAHAAVQADEQ